MTIAKFVIFFILGLVGVFFLLQFISNDFLVSFILALILGILGAKD